MIKSLREPQLEPSTHAYTILQDHGPDDGGWGPAAIMVSPLQSEPHPFVYTGSDEMTIGTLNDLSKYLAEKTGKPTKFVRYSEMEIIGEFE